MDGAAWVMLDEGWLSLNGVTMEKCNAVVGKYLEKHPDQWDLDAVQLIYRALHAAWPGKVAAPYQW